MLDENLPTFFLKNNSQSPQQSTIYHRQYGNDPEPTYTLRRLDPADPSSENHYGVALSDPWVPGIVYGEVSVKPEWTQPSLSADAIRANGGVVPPPEPIIPPEFTVQLYNPDQQVVVYYKAKTWNRPAHWVFEMPQRTFRLPSASTLDRTQSDPATADVTPKLRFSWRKDGKLSKDLSCLLHGKTSTMPDTKHKSREPDITVAIFQGLKELTLYEPNLYRVEMEDFKGLEVVLLLAAVAIRDIFFGSVKEVFNIKAGGASTVPGRKSPKAQTQGAPPATALPDGKPAPRISIPNSPTPAPQPRPRPRQDNAAEEEARRTQTLLEKEKREREQAKRRRDQEIELETKRLQEIYGKEEQQARLQAPAASSPSRPNLPPRHSGPARPQPHRYSQSYSLHASEPVHSPWLPITGVDPRAQSTANLHPPRPMPPRPQSTVGFYQIPTSSGALLPGPSQTSPPQLSAQQKLQPKKSSFFGFRRNKEEASPGNKLDKKRSSMF
ncbi:hypothetical protein N7468_007152 [Penicillium chermesinum]|uniref:Uncharacterized protein n=1 Tax=Penicillium chermesinum TaxID=63820 RepID=A0A9W9NTJ3_9EURO|nr:uncharacterized protein N7468_007152 [Penicillium chermesinum]KAJ5225927.1 hypothetical protein N7468_007152 [Penicillium chermesinum]